ncbi:hypothetical protein K8T06_13315 [bacterium]|nr:hypothetical protein [bacterium]
MKYYCHQTAASISEEEIKLLKYHLDLYDQDYFPNLSSRGLGINDFIKEWQSNHGSMMAFWREGVIVASIGYWYVTPGTIYIDWLNVPQSLRMTRVLYQLIKLSCLRESEIAKPKLVTARTWEGCRTVTRLMFKLGLGETHRISGELCSQRVSLYYEGDWMIIQKSLRERSSKILPLKRLSATLWANKPTTRGQHRSPLVPQLSFCCL